MDHKKKDFLVIEKEQVLLTRGIELLSFDTLDSTQSEARRHVSAGGHSPTLILANTQTEGRGRLGRSFFSPPESGIYMTLLCDVTDSSPYDIAHVTSAVAVACARAIEGVTGVACGIKWVNDLYVGERKACGIIAESFSANDRRFCAIGVGVNLCTRDFPDELSDIAVSLTDTMSDELRRELTLELAASVFDVFDILSSGDVSYMDEYRARSVVLGHAVRFTRNGALFEGIATDIDDEGGLVVRLPDGSKITLMGGEITLRLKEQDS